MRPILCILAVIAIYLPAHAQVFSAGVGTEVPIGLSLDGMVSFPAAQVFSRVRYAGFLESYTDAMNSTAESMDYYNSATSDIISESLKEGSLIELALGWAQAPEEGWFTDLAYSMIKGQGKVTGATIAAAVANISLPAGTNLYDIEGEIEALSLNGGYRFKLNSLGALHVSFGVMKPISSKTSINRPVSGPVQQNILNTANRNLDNYMADTLENDVYIPVIGANWLYTF